MSEAFGSQVEAQFRELKHAPRLRVVAVPTAQEPGWLEPVTWSDLESPEAIRRLGTWRERGADGFPSQFPVTDEGTARWLRKGLLEVPDRMLFWVNVPGAGLVGHVGLFRLDAGRRAMEIDNIVRGEPAVLPGIMFQAVTALIDWSVATLGLEHLSLRVFSDNARALRLYERCGFRETVRAPVVRVEEAGGVRWEEVGADYREPVGRYFVTMHLPAAGRMRAA